MNKKIFNATEKDFNSKEDYEKYMDSSRCAICHKKLEVGDKFELRPIQTPAETGCNVVQVVIVHTKCIDKGD